MISRSSSTYKNALFEREKYTLASALFNTLKYTIHSYSKIYKQ